MSGWRVFAAVRPYGESIRTPVFSFLSSMGFEVGDGMLIAPGTPDQEAARTVEALSIELLLLPFHLHRDRDGNAVDGVGVLERLSAGFFEKRIPILMPVSAFSLRASFPRRLAELEDSRAEVSRNLVIMPEDEIGSDDIRSKINELLRGAPS